MPVHGQESYPLPDDPALAEVARALRDTGQWGHVVDDRWLLAYAPAELGPPFGGYQELASFAICDHCFGPESIGMSKRWRFGGNTTEIQRVLFAGLGPLV